MGVASTQEKKKSTTWKLPAFLRSARVMTLFPRDPQKSGGPHKLPVIDGVLHIIVLKSSTSALGDHHIISTDRCHRHRIAAVRRGKSDHSEYVHSIY